MILEERDLDFELFISKVKGRTGIDLAQYKEAQMKRRLTTLRMKKGYSTFASFYEAMIADKELMYEFLDRMTINVSEFWRNANRWEIVEKRVLPEMIQTTGRKLKVWSAACSTGEEPYTIAMIMAELGILSNSLLVATDIDEGALAKAKAGLYEERSLREVPSAYAAKYFSKQPDRSLYSISDTLKKEVRFQKQNLLTDPFDTQFDLIVCRNVMIYFTEEAKQQLYHKFGQALKPGGILFVGSTEQIFSAARYSLDPVDTFFYRRV
jgi:chemotaxis protein methyltransferase CheR